MEVPIQRGISRFIAQIIRFRMYRTKYIVKLAIIALIFGQLYSCTNHRDGYLITQDQPFPITFRNIDSLLQQKECLTIESEKIFNSIKIQSEESKAITGSSINRLFQNLHEHYKLDSYFQHLSIHSSNSSLKQIGYVNLIKAAIFYQKKIQSDKRLRRIVNRGDKAFHIQARTHLRSQQFLWHKKTQEFIDNQKTQFLSGRTKSDFIRENCADMFIELYYNIFGIESKILGNIFGSICFNSKPNESINQLIPSLKKWDIVCFKSRLRLTDKLIPGFFGHVGIYLGDGTFVESVQKGVIYSNSFDFAESNSIIVIRPRTITSEQDVRMSQILRAQLGKDYDYNFNVESPDKIFCSELVYLVFEHIDWETRNIGNQFSLSPDHILQSAMNDNKFDIPFYTNNEARVENPNKIFVNHLIQQKSFIDTLYFNYYFSIPTFLAFPKRNFE